jgi:drug/metabolite transporter (DMT)-like permease
MSWLLIALTSYFLGSLVIILDKFILSGKKISSPPVYSFYIAILSLGVLILAPFSFSIPPAEQIVASLISGALFTFGILALYFAIRIGQASRVATFVGAVIPFFTFVISVIFFSEQLNGSEIIGAFLLIFGGLLVTFDLPLKTDREIFFDKFKYALLAGLLLAVAYSIFKIVYAGQSFLCGFIWTRLGSAIAVAGFFLVPGWRKEIIASLKQLKKPTQSHYYTGTLVILNKIIGGVASILFNYAIALGSVTLVNALVASQYIFILIFASLFSVWYPRIFEEKIKFWDWMQKVAAIILIGAGIYLIAKPASVGLF